jgi:hypothetical protein
MASLEVNATVDCTHYEDQYMLHMLILLPDVVCQVVLGAFFKALDRPHPLALDLVAIPGLDPEGGGEVRTPLSKIIKTVLWLDDKPQAKCMHSMT